MPSAYALGIVSRNSILDFGVAERLRAFRYSFFTGGVVMENGRCSAASYGSATLRTFPTIAARNKKAIVFASLHQRWLRIGAADEARTRYLHLGKVALYQMSYGRILHVACRGFCSRRRWLLYRTAAPLSTTNFQKLLLFAKPTQHRKTNSAYPFPPLGKVSALRAETQVKFNCIPI